jgi:hypothetical protein
METIGVIEIEPFFVLDEEPLMKDLFFFDKLVYNIDKRIQLEKFCNSLPKGKESFIKKIQEIEKLQDFGLISEYKYETYYEDLSDYGNIESLIYELKANKLASEFSTKDKPFKEIFVDFLLRFREVAQLKSRMYSIILNKKESNFYTPILKGDFYNHPVDNSFSTNKVLSVLLNKFPIPSDDFDIKDFIAFKNDPDTKLKLLRLKDWVIEISKKDYTSKEIEQKIEYLLEEYTNQFEIHKIKYNLSSFETIVSISLEVLENIVKLNFSKASKALFDLRKQELNLLEAEQKLMGRELALIYKIKNRL